MTIKNLRATAEAYKKQLDDGCTITQLSRLHKVVPDGIYNHLYFLDLHEDVQAAIESEQIALKLAVTGVDCICYGFVDEGNKRELLTPVQQLKILRNLQYAFRDSSVGIPDNDITRAILAKIKGRALTGMGYRTTRPAVYQLRIEALQASQEVLSREAATIAAALRAAVNMGLIKDTKLPEVKPLPPVAEPIDPLVKAAKDRVQADRDLRNECDKLARRLGMKVSLFGRGKVLLAMTDLQQLSRTEVAAPAPVAPTVAPPKAPKVPLEHPVAAWLRVLTELVSITVSFDGISATLPLNRRQAIPGSALLNHYQAWVAARQKMGILFQECPDADFSVHLTRLLGNIKGPEGIYVLPTASIIRTKLGLPINPVKAPWDL